MHGVIHVLNDGEKGDRKVAHEKLAALTDLRAETFPRHYYLHRMLLWPRTATVSLVYLIRNYGTDGILPMIAGLTAIAALYGFDIS
jgi:hypothetical protein